MDLDYATSKTPVEPFPRRAVLIVVAVVLIAILLIAAFLPSLGKPREAAQRAKCMSNLRQIGTALAVYAQGNAGQLPPDLMVLAGSTDLPRDVFICPNEPAGDLLRQHPLTTPSYVYVGAGMTWIEQRSATSPYGREVLVFERSSSLHVPKDRESTTGLHVLFRDLHVEFIPEPAATQVLLQYDSGQRPIVCP
ncbi:MAG: DUF1559 domain-containing protein [Tepidisphaeraceae bacterium]